MTRWQMFTEWLEEVKRARRERAALARALEVFAQLHPDWYGALFDGPFLSRYDVPTLLAIDPRELATEWARQFAFRDVRRREREIARVADVATSLQELLAAELRRHEGRTAATGPTRAPARRPLAQR